MEKRKKGRPRVLPLHIAKLNKQWARARAQAHHRSEEWTITNAEWNELWLEDERYLQKGRHLNSLMMVRTDLEEGWYIDNVQILTRKEWHKTLRGRPRNKRNS